MNAKQLEQLLLLEQSGELSSKQRRRLDQELADSVESRKLRAGLRGLAATIPPISTQPAANAAVRIDARLRQAPKPAIAFLPAWKPALAAAAALALLLGVRTFHGGKTASPVADDSAVASAAAEEEDWVDPLEAEFTELESLLAAISSDDELEITEL